MSEMMVLNFIFPQNMKYLALRQVTSDPVFLKSVTDPMGAIGDVF